MARALLSCLWENASPNAVAGLVDVDVQVMYVGTDLPGGIGVDRDIVRVVGLDASQTPAQIVTAIAAAVRTRAASIGYTIGVNEVLAPSLSKG